jgi:choline-sulfatase
LNRMIPVIGPMLGVIGALACFFAPVAADQPRDVNVLLVTVDTFRPDRLSGYGNDRPTSPYLDSLAADGVLFEQAFSSSSWTTPGLMSVLTGQWAPTHGVDVRGKSLRPGTATFATELSKAGYATPDILYLSSIPNFQNLGLKQSFADRDKHLPHGDEVLFQALEAYQDSSFFFYYHYRNLHLPYNPSEPYDQLYTKPGYDRAAFVKDRVQVVRENVTIPVGSVTFAPSDSAWIYGLYDGQIREMDETFFKPLRQKLKDLGLYERTMVIVTADHGEELLEHGFVGHPSTSFKESAYEELVRIPLMMTCPALIPKGLRLTDQVQNVDILPTALDLLGLEIPASVQGRSLKSVFEGGALAPLPVFTETTRGGYQSTPEMMKVRTRAHRAPPWKLIHTFGPGIDRYELYHLDRDPGELEDVSGSYPDILGDMRRDLHAWVVKAEQPSIELPDRPVVIHTGEINVLEPESGDTLRYVDANMTVDVRWDGTESAGYAIEYQVGEGNYRLDGRIPVIGLVSTHGPFTEEMWNMLTLYNPYTFRVVADGEGQASAWVRFHIQPTDDARAPGLQSRLVVTLTVIRSESMLLIEGLWFGALMAIEAAGNIPLSDALGLLLVIGLAGALVGPWVIRKVGGERGRAWGTVVVYTGMIYATLSVVPEIWGTAFRLTRGRVDYTAPLLGAIAAIWILSRIVRKRLGSATLLAVVGLGAVYVWLLLWLSQSPAERFHLAEYGVLSYLTFRACRIDRSYFGSVAGGLAVAALLGAGDELIQWGLPNRVFEWKDIWLNIGSSCLGMVLVVLMHPEGRGDDA